MKVSNKISINRPEKGIKEKIMSCLFGHKWNDSCKCERCGSTRDERHDWVTLDGKCEEKCSICGKERTIDHKWNGDKCERCGITRHKHKWNGCKCEICGATRVIRGVPANYFTDEEIELLYGIMENNHYLRNDSEYVNISQADIQSLSRTFGAMIQELNSRGEREQIRKLNRPYSKLILLNDSAPAEAKAIAKLSVR